MKSLLIASYIAGVLVVSGLSRVKTAGVQSINQSIDFLKQKETGTMSAFGFANIFNSIPLQKVESKTLRP